MFFIYVYVRINARPTVPVSIFILKHQNIEFCKNPRNFPNVAQ